MMTGRDLILYILQNGLEDEPVFDSGILLGFMNEMEAAIRFDVGTSTIRAWIDMNMLPAIKLGNMFYIPVNAAKPEFKLN